MRFDIFFPSLLFIVTFVAMLLSKKAESKINKLVVQREFSTRDVALLVVMIGVMVSIIVFVPQIAIIAIFLFSYSALLFTVTYAFSDMSSRQLKLFCATNIIIGMVAGTVGSFSFFSGNLIIYGTFAFAIFVFCTFLALFYAERKKNTEQRWYIAALSPILFLLLFSFFNGTLIWFPFLLDAYGLIFAVLIVVYLSSLFTWKTVIVFGVFLTVLDIVLVWVTGTMVTTASALFELRLPILVTFPTIPPIIHPQEGLRFLSIGLGDFFFAGILSTQTLRKFGMKIAVLSILTMSVSFGIFELLLLNPSIFGAIPATLPIILGWFPVVAWKFLADRN